MSPKCASAATMLLAVTTCAICDSSLVSTKSIELDVSSTNTTSTTSSQVPASIAPEPEPLPLASTVLPRLLGPHAARSATGTNGTTI